MSDDYIGHDFVGSKFFGGSILEPLALPPAEEEPPKEEGGGIVRAPNLIVVLGPDGKPLAGATVKTRLRETHEDAEVFAEESGVTHGENPAKTDAHGKVVQWLERGRYESVVTAAGMEAYTEPWDSTPGGNGAIDRAWLDTDLAEGLERAEEQPPSGWQSIAGSLAAKCESTGKRTLGVRSSGGGKIGELRGTLAIAAGQEGKAGDALLELPEGYRPTETFKVQVTGSISIEIKEGGQVLLQSIVTKEAAQRTITLMGISFPIS